MKVEDGTEQRQMNWLAKGNHHTDKENVMFLMGEVEKL